MVVGRYIRKVEGLSIDHYTRQDKQKRPKEVTVSPPSSLFEHKLDSTYYHYVKDFSRTDITKIHDLLLSNYFMY